MQLGTGRGEGLVVELRCDGWVVVLRGKSGIG